MAFFRYLLLAALSLFAAVSVSGQRPFKVDSLKKEMANAPEEKKAVYYNQICRMLRNSNPQQAVEYGKKAIRSADAHKNYEELAKAYSFAGVAFRNSGDFSQALAHYGLGKQIAEKHNLSQQLGYAHINFANVFIYTAEYRQAQKHLRTADSLARSLQDPVMSAYTQLNKGRIYIALNRFDSARFFLDNALQMRQAMRDVSGQAVCYRYIGDLEQKQGKTQSALEAYDKALEKTGSRFDNDFLSDLYAGKAKIFLKQKHYGKAEENARKALHYALITNNSVRIKAAYENLTKIFKNKGEPEKALEFSESAKQYTDSMYQSRMKEKVANVIYQNQKEESQAQIDNLEKDAMLKEAKLNNERMRQRVLLVFVLFVIVVLSGIFFFYRQKRKAYAAEVEKNRLISEQYQQLQQNNEEIKTQRDAIETQKTAIEKQQNLIKDSITYAERIQKAALPKKEFIESLFPYYFVLYLPKDIVSGDFYFVKKIGKYLFSVAADCTGHGVPGAFVSMLGISLLTEITEKQKITSPELILEELRKNIKNAFKQNMDSDSQDDGMDMSLAVINSETLEMEYAGANNSIYIIRNHELTELKPTLNPVGIYFREKPFKKIKFQLQKNDSIYMFSDGYIDQFGEKDNRRFMASNLKKTLISLQKYPMKIQRNLLKQQFFTRMGKLKQIDDVLVIGIKIANLLNKEE